MKLPKGEKAEVDLRKLEQYLLDPNHQAGGHKARVFRAALSLTSQDAGWLRAQVLKIAATNDAIAGSPSPFGRSMSSIAELEAISRPLLCELCG